MALENEITRVAGGTKDTLKALITKLGGTVGDELIDQYPVLANGATKPDKWDKGILLDGGTLKDVDGNDISADVKSALNTNGGLILIDLYSAGVNVDMKKFGENIPFEVSTDIVTQLVAAAKTGGALLKFGFMMDGIPVPVQAYLTGSAIEIMQAYQFSGKVTLDANAINVFVVMQLQNSSTQVSTRCTVDQNLPLPETTNEGAFLRVQGGVWAAVQVPEAEEASF